MSPDLFATNHRGTRVPRTLGFLLGGAALLATVARGGVGREGWAATTALLVVLTVGVIDDLAPQVARGIRGHLAALTRGRPTTGVAKLVVIVVAAFVVAGAGRTAVAEALAGAVLIASSANLGNALDVRPGRTLKVMTPLCLVGLLAPGGAQPYLPGLLVALCPALALDLRERAMLGDGGSNLVGFAAGVALAAVLPLPWLAVAAAVAVGLTVLSEVVSLSAIIDGNAALRALDRLGRLPD
jgi:hypothetical protein